MGPVLIGHPEPERAFMAAVRSGRLHHAWLLAGPEGVGKRRFADMAALHLLAGGGPHLDVADDHPAARLVAAGSHLDHRVLMRETDAQGRTAGEIRIDQIRLLQPLFRATPALGPWRTIIIDSIDDLNRAAANALLKNLEEPPPQTVFFLISHAPARLLPTIRSRTRLLRFRPLDTADTIAVLKAEGLGEDAAAALAPLAAGAPGQALRFADGGAAAGLADAMEQVLAGGDIAGFARQFQPPSAQSRFEALLLLAPRRLAAAARNLAVPQAIEWQAEASVLAADAARLALDRVQVAFALAQLLARAGRLEGSKRPQ
jgi:DNA polymerase-3 subunit delta'